MNKRKRCFIVAVCVLVGGWNSLKAQDKLVVHSVEGEALAWQIPLSGLRKITFFDTGLTFVKTDGSSRIFVYPYVDKITFELSGEGSIKNNSFLPGLFVYPNPTARFIRIAGWNGDEKETISVYSMNGKLAYVINDWCGAPIDVTSLPPGFYLLKINRQSFKFRKL